MTVFHVKYDAVVFRPFKNEVLSAVVDAVNKYGFFARAAGVSIFVSTHNMPESFVFNPDASPPAFNNDADNVTIAKDYNVRLRILGVDFRATSVYCIGTIDDDFLGVLS